MIKTIIFRIQNGRNYNIIIWQIWNYQEKKLYPHVKIIVVNYLLFSKL